MSDSLILDSYDARKRKEIDWLTQPATAPAAEQAAAPPAPVAAPPPTQPVADDGSLWSRARNAIAKRYAEGSADINAAAAGPPGVMRGVGVVQGVVKAATAPLAGVGSVTGEGGAAIADYTGAMSDETLRARLANANMSGFDDKALVEKLLGMTYQQRLEYVHNVAGVAGEVAAGFVSPAGIVKGAARALGVGAKVAEVGAVAAEASTAGKLVEGATTAKNVVGGVTKMAGAADNLAPNVERMGVSDAAKKLAGDIGAKLQDEGLLSRSAVHGHEAVKAEAAASPYRNIETILGHNDSVPLSDVHLTAMRNTFATVSEQTAELVTRFHAGEAGLQSEALAAINLEGQIGAKVINTQTATGRALGAGNIVSEVAPNIDLSRWAGTLKDWEARLSLPAEQVLDNYALLRTAEQRAAYAEALAKQPNAAAESFNHTYFGLNLLSSWSTHIANTVGNTAQAGLYVANRAAGAVVSRPFKALGMMREETAGVAEAGQMVTGLPDRIADAFHAAVHTFKTGERRLAGGKAEELGVSLLGEKPPLPGLPSAEIDMTQDGSVLGKFIDVAGTIARGGLQATGAAGQKILRTLTSADEFWSTLNYSGEVRALALRKAVAKGLEGEALVAEQARLIAHPEADMIAQASLVAKTNTFAQDFQRGNHGVSNLWGAPALGQDIAGLPPFKYTVSPFYKTPVRLFEAGLDTVPGLNLIKAQMAGDFAAGGARAELAMGKFATSMVYSSLFYEMGANGYLTGVGPKDPKLRKQMEEAGWQPFAVYNPVDQKYHSYKALLPIMPVIGFAATLADMSSHIAQHDLESLTLAMGLAFSDGATDQPFWQGASEAFTALAELKDKGTGAAMLSFVNNRVASLVPGAAALRTVERTVSGEKHDTKLYGSETGSPRGLQAELQLLFHKVQAMIPGYADNLPAERNAITGEHIMKPSSLGGLNPFAVTKKTKDPVLTEIVFKQQGAGLPSEAPRSLGGSNPALGPLDQSQGEGIRLTEKERDTLIDHLTMDHIGGYTLHERLAKEFDSPAYKDGKLSDGPDGGKAMVIKKIYAGYLRQAEARTEKDHPQLGEAVLAKKIARKRGLLAGQSEE